MSCPGPGNRDSKLRLRPAQEARHTHNRHEDPVAVDHGVGGAGAGFLSRGAVAPSSLPAAAPTPWGDLPIVEESPRTCAFSQCARSAIVMLILLVDDEESALVVCDRQADWLRGYVATSRRMTSSRCSRLR
jgi:hypothetical protein